MELKPKGKLIVKKTSDYEGLFLDANSVLSIGANHPSVPMGDDVATISNFFSSANIQTVRLFTWQANIYDPNVSAPELSTPIKQLYLYNKIINEVMESEGSDNDYKKRLQMEAKGNRAYCNLMLINLYGKPYNNETAATDPGIPIITEADVTQNSFTRATVQQVYQSIIADLAEAIPFLPVNNTARIRLTKSGAELVLAKAYLYMGDYAKALALINTAKTHYPTEFPVAIYDYNETYKVATWTVSSLLNTESLYTRTSGVTWPSTSNDLVVAPWVINLYGPNDQRLKSFTDKPNNSTISNPAGLMRRKGPFASQASQGAYLSDVELMKAECEARIGDVASALKTLIAFRKLRMPAADAEVNITGKDNLIKFIIDERVREFAVYGYRWYDMRRLSVDPLFRDKVYQHIQYNAANGQPLEIYTLKPERLTMRFDLVVMNANPEMINNP
ncbi:RagB/SusD family nutrient uptake outer membrane protein [Pedobacter sp. P26]|uniref:RagB/SusD family nutrient uptake outer membrane protein n=1 Tax=Pedobacter sp. P26 TaxID=3423956 RepID=UPI003D673D04